MAVTAESSVQKAVHQRTTWDRARMTLRANRMGMIGLVILIVEVILAIFAP